MERIVAGWLSQVIDALAFAALGIAIGIGQALRDREREWSVVIGRSICVGGLSMSAGVVLIWIPQMPFVAMLGVAAFLASMGTAFLERLLMRAAERLFPSQSQGQE